MCTSQVPGVSLMDCLTLSMHSTGNRRRKAKPLYTSVFFTSLLYRSVYLQYGKQPEPACGCGWHGDSMYYTSILYLYSTGMCLYIWEITSPWLWLVPWGLRGIPTLLVAKDIRKATLTICWSIKVFIFEFQLYIDAIPCDLVRYYFTSLLVASTVVVE
jgi:hypothetical protein